MGVQSGSAGGGILLFGEQPFQLGVLGRPVFLVGVKGICKTAPAYILRKHLLLLGGGTAMLLLQSEQGPDGFNIAGEFLLGASDTQIIIRDVEVPGRLPAQVRHSGLHPRQRHPERSAIRH